MKSLRFSVAVFLAAVTLYSPGTRAQSRTAAGIAPSGADSAFQAQVQKELAAYPHGLTLYHACDGFSRWINCKAALALGLGYGSGNANHGKNDATVQSIDTNIHTDISRSIEDEDEPSIAINRRNPNLIVAGANDLEMKSNGQATGMNTLGMPAYLTSDGGFTWKTYRLPLATNDPGAEEWGDPMIVCNDAGMFYYSFLMYPELGGYSDLMVAHSTDGIHWTLGNPVVGNQNNNAFEDKETIAVDNDPSSPYHGRLYIAWTEYDNTGNTLADSAIHYVAHSDDHGVTWSSPMPFSTYYGDFALLRVGQHGTAFIASMHYYGTITDSTVTDKSEGMSISTDGGATFQDYPMHAFTDFPPIDQGRNGLKGPNGFRASPYPCFDVDSGNTIRAVYGTYDEFNADAALYEISSTDLGKDWSAPAQIGTRSSINNDHYMPWVAIDPVTHSAYISMSSSEEDTVLNVKSRAVWCNYNSPATLNTMGSDLFNPLTVTAEGGDFVGDYATSDAYGSYFVASWTENRQPSYHDGDIFAYVAGPLTAPAAGQESVRAIDADEFSVGAIDPDPASGNAITMNISSSAARTARIRLFDLKGNEVLSHDESIQPSGANSISLDIHLLPAGVYHVVIQSGVVVVDRNLVILR